MPRATAIFILVALALVTSVATAHAAGPPMRVGLTGDSIVEGGGVTSATGLQVALSARLRRLGYGAAASGYVPAHGFTLRRRADGAVSAAPWIYRGDWTFLGLPPFFDVSSPIAHSMASQFGADGHATESASPRARATARIAGDRFAVLFVRGPDAGRFRFSVDARTRTIDARAPVLDGRGVVWLDAPKGRRREHVVTVAPLTGTLRLTGVLSRRRASVQLLSLGQASVAAGDGLAPAQRQALSALHLKLTLIMFGAIDEGRLEPGNSAATRAALVSGLRLRGALARRHGGRCTIVPPAPDAHSLQIQSEVFVLERRAAALAGCRFAPVLAGLWNPATSVAAGLTHDGIHPTPAGYRLMARALARAITFAAAGGARRSGLGPSP